MINPKAELFKWGPIDGRPIYIDQFIEGFVRFPKIINGSWPDTLGFFKNDRIVFVIEYPALRKSGEPLFRKYILNEKQLKKHYNQWIKRVNKIKKFEETVNKKIPENKLANLFIQWVNDVVEFWMEGFLPELSNYGEEPILKQKLLEKHKESFTELFEALSAPENLSFFQKEELRFMRIKLIKDKKEQLKKLKQHQKDYYWLENNYAFTKILDIGFFKKRLSGISRQQAKNKIKEIKDYIKNIKQKKKQVIKKYKVSREIANIARKLAYCVWWQDYRKQFIFIANHITTQFLKEIQKKKKIPFKELCYYRSKEIIELLKHNKKINAGKRFKGFAVYYHKRKGITYLEGKKANDLMRPYLEIKVKKGIKELRGLVVSSGKAKGKVKILYTPKKLSKMKKGNILVAPMTSPDYITAMRKAAAVITDEGGMTCHAAIVSRELKIPCIVATKIATKVLKDNDLVEVDAEKGIVKVIKKWTQN
jgi:phosphohistidine swiveling domain-containing protein